LREWENGGGSLAVVVSRLVQILEEYPVLVSSARDMEF